MPSGYNALAARPKNKLAYPGQDLVEAFTQGLGPMLYGAAKGTAATVVGLPGDIEQLARQLLLSGAAPDSYTAKNMAAQALLPTSDRVKAMLPSLSSFGAGPQAQYSENMGASLGQNVVGNLVAPKALPAIVRAGQGLPVGASIKAVDDAAIFKDASVLINPKNLKPLNKVEDVEKYKTIVNSMEESGYQGRPILAYMDKGKAKALTGSHRIFAAREAGIDVPVVFVNPSVMKWEDKSGLFGTFKESIKDQRVYNYLKAAGDDVAASLSKLEDQVVQPSMSPYP